MTRCGPSRRRSSNGSARTSPRPGRRRPAWSRPWWSRRGSTPAISSKYGTLYEATLTADFSPHRRAELVDAYNHELVQHRLFTLGGSLGFVLICLAAISGYIRADEATKGYYTNRLRMLAAAGVGAAGVIVYRMVA